MLCSLLSYMLCWVSGKKLFIAICIVCFRECVCVCDPLKKKETKTNKSIHNPQQAMFATNEWCSGHLGHKQMLDGFLCCVVLFVFIYYSTTPTPNINCNQQYCICVAFQQLASSLDCRMMNSNIVCCRFDV